MREHGRPSTSGPPTGAPTAPSSCPPTSSTSRPNLPLMHQVVVAQQAAARQGTHDTKTRGEVRGGGKKPYRQKGTGRARQGSTRAPQFAGGGVVHGPTPRDYTQRTPKKMKAAALRGALSDRARDGRVHVVASFADGDAPSTKDRAGRAASPSPTPARCWWCSTATTSRAGRACATCRPVHLHRRRASSTRTTCWSATTWSSPGPRWTPSAGPRGRRRAARQPRRRRRRPSA